MKYTAFQKGVVGGMLTLTLATVAVPTHRVEAATLQELQAQIQTILAQLQALRNQLPATSNLGSCSLFNTDMTTGRSGNDVTALQRFLISRGHAIPAGATGYFGEQTRSALAQFQSQNGISPAIGYFGPVTRGRINALCATQQTPPTNTNNTGNTSNSGDSTGSNTNKPTTPIIQGEASLENYNATEGEYVNLEEGQKNVSVMNVTFDVQDGDARISRVDLGFTPSSANDETRPWRTFTEVSIYDGSKLLKKINASNRSSWRENNPMTGSYLLRVSGIDWVVDEDSTTELTIKVSTANNIRGSNNGETWRVFIPNNGIRGLDAKRASVYTGNTNSSISFSIDQGGSSDRLTVRRSSADIESMTLQLKDNARSGYLKIFAFDLDTNNSRNDIEIQRLPIQLTVSSGTVATHLHDARIRVGGRTFTRKTIVDGATNTMTFEFNRGEFTIRSGERVTVEVETDFKPLTENNEGVTIVGTVNTNGIIAEGSDDLKGNQLSGTVSGDTHVLYTRGIIGEAGTISSNLTSVDGPANDYVTFSVEVKVTAFGQNVYIPVNVNEAIVYQLQNNTGTTLIDTGVAVLTSNAREQNGYFQISEGETRTLTLEVIYRPGSPMTTARLQLMEINFNNSPSAPTQAWKAFPTKNYQTTTRTIVD
jgi:peptidoglycan hydrolase-like protein with peptidoglycan-binding domain